MTTTDAAEGAGALYAELPYPDDGVVRTTTARILEKVLARHGRRAAGSTIGDFGCGTGEVTLGFARRFPDARVTGFDVNPPSLDRARALAERIGAGVTFDRLDLTAPFPASVGPFDIVCCNGVLHHLPEPRVGFENLRGVVADDGLLLCSLYSVMGRWDDLAVRELLDAAIPEVTRFEERTALLRALRLGSKHTLRGFLRNLDARRRFGPPIVLDEIVRVQLNRKQLTHESDRHSNPCEHLYRFDELERLLTETGWELQGLAPGGGLPTSLDEHTDDPSTRAELESLDHAVLFDYFAYRYRTNMFTLVAAPHT